MGIKDIFKSATEDDDLENEYEEKQVKINKDIPYGFKHKRELLQIV